MPIEIPLMPLPNIVLFPGMLLPLHMFEPRYTAMTQTVLETGGTFGIVLCRSYNPTTLEGEPFEVGTTVDIEEHERMDDGSYALLTLGRRRFRVESLVEDDATPYTRARVEWLEDAPFDASQHQPLLETTKTLFYEAVRLSRKVMKKDFEEPFFPEDPAKVSFYIAQNLVGSLVLKQELLSATCIQSRLERERDILTRAVRPLAAQAQIEEAFRSSKG